LLDAFVGIPLDCFEKSRGFVERRKMYGQYGSFRSKPYGLEYRTPSNDWLWNDYLIDNMYLQVEKTFEKYEQEKHILLKDKIFKDFIMSTDEGFGNIAIHLRKHPNYGANIFSVYKQTFTKYKNFPFIQTLLEKEVIKPTKTYTTSKSAFINPVPVPDKVWFVKAGEHDWDKVQIDAWMQAEQAHKEATKVFKKKLKDNF
jgi:hypothetical protein